MDRAKEIRRLLRLTPRQLREKAKGRLVIKRNLDALHRHAAELMANEIAANNRAKRPTRLIVPVGPTGQYPCLVNIVRHRGLSLRNVHLFFMDEYCDAKGRPVPASHPLSFKGEMESLFFSRLPAELAPPKKQVVFPSRRNLDTLADRIAADGGIDTCYGGIGIHGHLAFNEPEPGVAAMGPRLVRLNAFTLTINAVRSHVGGNLEGHPSLAVSLGMAQILAARRIVLLCRNGCEFDWANTVLRLALFGTPGDDYPVTHIRRKDYLIVTDLDTAAVPKTIL